MKTREPKSLQDLHRRRAAHPRAIRDMTPAEIAGHDLNRLARLLLRHHAKDPDMSWVEREGPEIRERVKRILEHRSTVIDGLPDSEIARRAQHMKEHPEEGLTTQEFWQLVDARDAAQAEGVTQEEMDRRLDALKADLKRRRQVAPPQADSE